jgi:NADH-quinone oxidoreductase subunit H
VFTAVIAIATIPFGGTLPLFGRVVKLVIADLDVGILWVFAVGSLSVYGILLAGWSSGNKFAFLGGLRSSAQIISYELGLTLSVVGVLLFAGSLNLSRVVEAQGTVMWNFWLQPVGCLLFLVAMFAETNRNPFDLPEAESELVAGYHTEYSGMRFAMFFMAEYLAMVTMSALMVTLFFGGWKLPWLLDDAARSLGPLAYGLIGIAVFFAKVTAFLVLFIWTRWTLPRFRYDQLMALGWKGLLPLALLQLAAAGVKEAYGWGAYALAMALLLAGLFLFLRTPRRVAAPLPAALAGRP